MLVDPYRVDDVHAITEQPESFHITDERAAEFLQSQYALQLGLEHVHEERQTVAAAERIQFAEIVYRDALRRRTGHGGPQAAAGAAMPALNEVSIAGEQSRGVHRRGRAGAREQIGRQQLGEERQLVELRDIGLIEGEAGAHAAVRIRLHDGIDSGGGGCRYEKGVVEHGGDPGFEHLDGAENGRYIGGTRVVTSAFCGGLEQHEDLEWQAVERTFQMIGG